MGLMVINHLINGQGRTGLPEINRSGLGEFSSMQYGLEVKSTSEMPAPLKSHSSECSTDMLVDIHF